MPQQVPKEISDLVAQLDKSADVQHFTQLWHEYERANEQYERNYAMQFGHLVEGNRAFGQSKTMPTPPEQMRLLQTHYMELIEQHLADRELEQIYELEDMAAPEHQADKALEKEEGVEDFRLNWDDRDKQIYRGKQAKEQDKGDRDSFEQFGDKAAKLLEERQGKEMPEKEAEQPTYSMSMDFKVDFLKPYAEDFGYDEKDNEPNKEKEDYDKDLE